MILNFDYYDIFRNLIAKKGTALTVISDHSGVLIVETDKKVRFAINRYRLDKGLTAAPLTANEIKGGKMR